MSAGRAAQSRRPTRRDGPCEQAVQRRSALPQARRQQRTEWLAGADAATAYRARFTAAAAREQRLADIEEDLVDALAARTTPHLIVTVVPEQAGDMVIDSVPG
ncbi:hypothetical protein ACWEP4_37300 [Streptomyces sp. NPDC004227]